MTETVAEIRTQLVSMGMSEEEAAEVKGKSALIAKRDELAKHLENEREMELEEEPDEYVPSYSDESDEEPDEYVPSYEDDIIEEEADETAAQVTEGLDKITSLKPGTKEWEDFIMSQFTEDELIEHPNMKGEQLPCLAGLSRVGQLMFNVTNTGVRSYSTTIIDNHPATTVVYQIMVEEVENGVPTYREYSAIADAWHGSMSGVFNAYPAAIAESRAEARTWKKLLGLRNKPAYEEISNSLEGTSIFDDIEDEEDGMITKTQESLIESKCEQFGIDVYKYINKKHFTDKENNPEPEFSSISEVPYDTAAAMVKYLTKIQSCTDDSVDIPEELAKD